jgi:hypothetical protein
LTWGLVRSNLPFAISNFSVDQRALPVEVLTFPCIAAPLAALPRGRKTE